MVQEYPLESNGENKDYFHLAIEKISLLSSFVSDIIKNFYLSNNDIEVDLASIEDICSRLSDLGIGRAIRSIAVTRTEESREQALILKKEIIAFKKLIGEMVEAFFRKYLGTIGSLEKYSIRDKNMGEKYFVDLSDWQRSILIVPGSLEEIGNSFFDIIKSLKKILIENEYDSPEEIFDILLNSLKEDFGEIRDIDLQKIETMKNNFVLAFANLLNMSDILEISSYEKTNIILDFFASYIMPFLLGGAEKKVGLALSQKIAGEKVKKIASVPNMMISSSKIVSGIALLSAIANDLARFEDEMQSFDSLFRLESLRSSIS